MQTPPEQTLLQADTSPTPADGYCSGLYTSYWNVFSFLKFTQWATLWNGSSPLQEILFKMLFLRHFEHSKQYFEWHFIIKYICPISVTRIKCGVRSTLSWKIGNISGSTEFFGL